MGEATIWLTLAVLVLVVAGRLWPAARSSSAPPSSRSAKGQPGHDGYLKELMARYQQADRQAAAQLVEALSPKLFSFFSRSGVSPPQAEKLVEDCWTRIHEARHTFRPDAPFGPWLYAIACHILSANPPARRRPKESVTESPARPFGANAGRNLAGNARTAGNSQENTE